MHRLSDSACEWPRLGEVRDTLLLSVGFCSYGDEIIGHR